MGLLSRGSVQSYFYLFEGLGINSHSPMRARRKPAPANLERAFALFWWLRRVIPASNHC